MRTSHTDQLYGPSEHIIQSYAVCGEI